MKPPQHSAGVMTWLMKPSRSVAVMLGTFAVGISWEARFWVFPAIGVIILVATRVSPFLAKQATSRFVGLTAIVMSALTLPRGHLVSVTGQEWLGPASTAIAISALLVLSAATVDISRVGRVTTVTWSFVALWVTMSGILTILADPEPWIDVWKLHRAAGDALRSGANPYVGLGVPNEMPGFPSGSVFDGYPYPPLSLITFPLAHILFGDSRWMAVLAGACLVALFRRLSSSGITDSIAVLVLVAPGWPVMVQLAWTEPLTLLLLGFFVISRPHRRFRPALLGLTIASKQYLLIWAIPAIASWARRRPRAVMIAGGVTGAALGAGLAFGPRHYVEWVFLFHLTAPTPALGNSFPALLKMAYGVSIPFISGVGLVAALATGYFLSSRDPRTDGTMVLSFGAMLGVFFMLSYQSYPNYWYLVLGTLCLGMMLVAREETGDEASRIGATAGDLRAFDPA